MKPSKFSNLEQQGNINMGDKNIDVSFSEDERSALHSLAEIFHDRDDRDKVRKLINEGATITQIVQAYRTQKGMIYQQF